MKIKKPQDYSPKPSYIKMSIAEYNQGHNTGPEVSKEEKKEGFWSNFIFGGKKAAADMEEGFAGEQKVDQYGNVIPRKKKPAK